MRPFNGKQLKVNRKGMKLLEKTFWIAAPVALTGLIIYVCLKFDLEWALWAVCLLWGMTLYDYYIEQKRSKEKKCQK